MAKSSVPGKLLPGILRNLGWQLASRAIAALLSLGYLVIITRTLGVHGFGKFALLTGTAQIIANGLAFQCWQIIVQYGHVHLENGDDARLARLYRAAAWLDVISAVCGIGLAWLILHLFASDLGIGETLTNATLIFNIILLISVRSTPLGILRLRDRFSLAAIADTATPVIRLFGAVAVVLIHPTLQAFLIAWGIAEFITAGIYWVLLARTGDLALLWRRDDRMGEVIADNPGIVRFAITTNAASTLTVLAKQIPLLLIGGWAGTSAAGAYRLAAQLTQSLTKLSQLIARAAFPDMVRAVARDGLSAFWSTMSRAMAYGAVAATALFAVIGLLGNQLLQLIGGRDFASGYPVLLWLAAAGCVDLVTAGYEALLTAAKRAPLTLLFRGLATAILVITAYLLHFSRPSDGTAAGVFAYSLSLAAMLIGAIAWLARERPTQKLPSHDPT